MMKEIQQKLWACLVLVFKNCFLLLKTKNLKNLFREKGVFLFFVFSVFLKTIFLKTIKKGFHYFFIVQTIDFFCVVFFFLMFSTKMSSTQLSQSIDF